MTDSQIIEQILNPKLKRDKYIELRQKGHTKEQIAEQYGVHKYSLTVKIRNWGLNKWQPSEPVPPKPLSKPNPKETQTEHQEPDLSYLSERTIEDNKDHIPDVTKMVEHPPHYTAGKVECIDAIMSACIGLTPQEAICQANVIKYVWRFKHKNGKQDLQKALWYLNRLIELQS